MVPSGALRRAIQTKSPQQGGEDHNDHHRPHHSRRTAARFDPGIWDHCWDVVVNHYADFTGIATRREFWTFYLARLIVGLVTMVIPFVGTILIFGTLIPTFAIGARRLHDMGHSGWWQLLLLIPILGWIALIVMLCQPTNDHYVTPPVRQSRPLGPSSGPIQH